MRKRRRAHAHAVRILTQKAGAPSSALRPGRESFTIEPAPPRNRRRGSGRAAGRQQQAASATNQPGEQRGVRADGGRQGAGGLAGGSRQGRAAGDESGPASGPRHVAK